MSLEDLIAQQVKAAVTEAIAPLLAHLAAPQEPEVDDDQVLTVLELAAYLGIGKNAAYGLANQSTPPFPVKRINGRIVIPKWSVRRWLEAGGDINTSGEPRLVLNNPDSAHEGDRQRTAQGLR